MSNIEKLKNVEQIVKFVQPQFEELARIHNVVNFKAEASFAMQALTDNAYLASVAMGNPDSLKNAIINVAAIGLSLGPVEKLAYLVPRKGKVCLDISYRGYLRLAFDIGAIKWAVAELVYTTDEFEYMGIGKMPIHKFNPFNLRGELIGGYVVAKTHGDEFIVTHMALDDIYGIRDRSESWKAHRDKGVPSPWATDESEMIKKTLIRRAQKSWPGTDTHMRFERAIEASNEADPMLFSLQAGPNDIERKDLLLKIRSALDVLGRAEDRYVEYLVRINSRKIECLEDLTTPEMEQAVIMLDQLVDERKGKK